MFKDELKSRGVPFWIGDPVYVVTHYDLEVAQPQRHCTCGNGTPGSGFNARQKCLKCMGTGEVAPLIVYRYRIERYKIATLSLNFGLAGELVYGTAELTEDTPEFSGISINMPLSAKSENIDIDDPGDGYSEIDWCQYDAVANKAFFTTLGKAEAYLEKLKAIERGKIDSYNEYFDTQVTYPWKEE